MISFSEVISFVAAMFFNLLLVGTVISVAVFIGLNLTRSSSPRIRYLLVVIAFAVAAVLPFLIALKPARSPHHSHGSKHTGFANSRALVRPIGTGQHVNLDAASSTQPDIALTVTASVSRVQGPVANVLAKPRVSKVLFSVWLIGAFLLLGREIAGHLFAVRARRRWKPASTLMRTRLSWPENLPLAIDNEFGPCALGIFHPTVVMPAPLLEELSAAASQQVARHELHHLKWRDPLVNTMMRMTRAWLWPSLPLWYLHRAASLEQEAAADRAAIGTVSGSRPDDALEYAATLLSIARKRAETRAHPRYSFLVTGAGRRAGLNDRVRRLMVSPGRPSRANLVVAGLTLLTSVFVLTVAPVVRVQSENNFRTSNSVPVTEVTTGFESEVADIEETRRPIADHLLPVEEQRGHQRGANSSLVIDKGGANFIGLSSPTQETPNPPVEDNLSADDFQNRMAVAGYKNLSPKQVADMKAYAVSPAYVAEMARAGYIGLSADMLIRFKWLAVSTSYIEEMKVLGYNNLTPETLADFRWLGVSSNYIREMRALVSGPISAEQLVSMRLHGASKEFIGQLHALGYKAVSAEQLISMRMHDVTVAYIEAAKSRGLRNLSLDDLIGMRMRNNN